MAVENHSRSRLFTFGCSFTRYKWPTWADIISKSFNEFQNWSKPGGGNCFILWSLIEAIERNNIGPTDTVAIMWSSVAREDRWVNGEWITPGSIYTQNENNPYSDEFVKKLADPDGYLIRDLANVAAAKRILDGIGCKYYMMSIVPFTVTSPVHPSFLQKVKSKFLWMSGESREQLREEFPSDSDRIISMYKDVLKEVRPSAFEIIFNNDWLTRKGLGKGTTWIMNDYEESRKTWAKDKGWPEFSDLLDGKISDEALESVKQCYGFSKLEEFFETMQRLEMRDDIHPTPLEHLEYIEKVLPEIAVSDKTREWVNDMQSQAEKGIFYEAPWPLRF